MKPMLPFAFVAALWLLAGCDTKPESFGNVMETSSTGTTARQFDCESKNADGSCNVNKCTQGPGGATFDCASFGAACIDAGHHWSGTKEGGKCTRVL